MANAVKYKKDNKLEAILSAAAGLITEKGYERTSFQDIADRVGLGKSTLFHYLKNKEELLVRIYERGVDDVSTDLEKINADSELEPEEKLKWAIRNHVTTFIDASSDATIFLNELGTLSEENQARFRMKKKQYQKSFQNIITDLMKKGYFKGLDVKGVTFGILGMLNWVPRWYKSDGKLNPKQISEIFFQMIIQGTTGDGGLMTRESTARTLATFIHDISYEKLPDTVTHQTKNLILDALGTALAGRDMPGARIALKMAEGGKGRATVFGHNLAVPASDAVFANVASMNALALDDFLYSFHPGQVNVPAAIAIAEEAGASGADLIRAVVAGYEAMGRVYLGGQIVRGGFRGVSVFGPFGAAAVASKLLKLDVDQTTNALCFAANFASGLTQCWINGTMEGHFHAGLAAKNGITAARLAQAGAQASEETLEGKCGFYQAFTGASGAADRVVSGFGEKFLIMDACYKPYPVCALQQIPIHMALELKARHSIDAQMVQVIVERVPHAEANFPGGDFAGPFDNAGQTLLSSQFCAAAAILGKPVNLWSFYEEGYKDPDVLALAQKVVLIGEKDRTTREISLTLKDGTTYRIEDTEDEGMLEPTDERIWTKFEGLTRPLIGEKRAREISDTVASLEKVADIRELTDKLKGL